MEAAPATADPAALKAYLKVQNGSDVRGVALDLNPADPVTLTASMMFFLGGAFAGACRAALLNHLLWVAAACTGVLAWGGLWTPLPLCLAA